MTELPELVNEDLWLLHAVSHPFLFFQIFNVAKVAEIDENLTDLPELDNEDSERLRITYATFPPF